MYIKCTCGTEAAQCYSATAAQQLLAKVGFGRSSEN